jgi:hypothetical protein
MDCKIITIQGGEFISLGWPDCFQFLKFNRNWVDRHTICQSTKMERLCSQDSKPKFSQEAKTILIFIENHFYKEVL